MTTKYPYSMYLIICFNVFWSFSSAVSASEHKLCTHHYVNETITELSLLQNKRKRHTDRTTGWTPSLTRLEEKKDVLSLEHIQQESFETIPNSIYLSGVEGTLLILPWQSTLSTKGKVIGKLSHELTINIATDPLSWSYTVSPQGSCITSLLKHLEQQKGEYDVKQYIWKQFNPSFFKDYYDRLSSKEEHCSEKVDVYKESYDAYLEWRKGYDTFIENKGHHIARIIAQKRESHTSKTTFSEDFSRACQKEWQLTTSKAQLWKKTFTYRVLDTLTLFATGKTLAEKADQDPIDWSHVVTAHPP